MHALESTQCITQCMHWSQHTACIGVNTPHALESTQYMHWSRHNACIGVGSFAVTILWQLAQQHACPCHAEERRVRSVLLALIGQVATAATMARLLSATPQCGTGPSTVAIFDIHALQAVRRPREKTGGEPCR